MNVKRWNLNVILSYKILPRAPKLKCCKTVIGSVCFICKGSRGTYERAIRALVAFENKFWGKYIYTYIYTRFRKN